MAKQSTKNKAVRRKPVTAAKETAKNTTKEYSFFTDVYDVVRQIPKGKVTSYGAIAAYLGTKLSARMVGWAMNGAHAAKPKVPAQRVVNRNGMLTGKHHFGTSTAMEELLMKDGVKVKDDKVVDFVKRFWDPSKELAL
ncbi:MAG: MGMT family protein [Ferruginibacter sp.]|nr:MGMT family protein [Ferruginibacter sp.]